jgi:hypothetical protein
LEEAVWLDIILGLLLLIASIDGWRRHWFLSLLSMFSQLFILFLIVRREPWLKYLLIQKLHLHVPWVVVAAFFILFAIVALLTELLKRILKRSKTFRHPRSPEGRAVSVVFTLIAVGVSFILLDLMLVETGWRAHISHSLQNSRVAGVVHQCSGRIVRPIAIEDVSK